jgi:hypothetical protein
LLALDTAGALGLRRRVLLPFDRERFRDTSVTDRPGEWGALYDRILDEVESAGDLLIEPAPVDQGAYAFVTIRILEEAGRLAAGSAENQMAVVVWDGRTRGADDLADAFRAAAAARGIKVLHVSTLE